MERRLADLVDLSALHALLDGSHRLTGIPAAIQDLEGNLVLRTGGQEVCRRFHLAHPGTHAACVESDTTIASEAAFGEVKVHRCLNGLTAFSTPIVAAGRPVANLIVGPFFLDDDVVDLEQFRARAREFGFDEAEYLASVSAIPRWSREKVSAASAYYAGLAGMISSLTERKAAEEKVEQQLALLELAQKMAGIGYWSCDGATGTPQWSEQMYAIFGRDPVLGPPTHDELCRTLHPDDREPFEEAVRRAVLGTPYDLVLRVILPDGSLRWIATQGRPRHSADGSLLHLFGTSQDVTATRQREEELRSGEARFQALFEHSPIAIWEEDFSEVRRELDALRATGIDDLARHLAGHPEVVARCAGLVRILQINESSVRLFGAASKDEVVLHLPEYFVEESLPAFREELVALAGGATRFECEVPVDHRAAGRKVLQLSLAVEPGYEETLGRVIVSVVDVTERRKAEEAIRVSEEQHRRLVEHLQAGVVVHGPDTRIRFANAKAKALLGLSEDEIQGRVAIDPAWCFLAEDGRRLAIEEYPVSRVVSTGLPVDDLVLGTRDPRSKEDRWVVVTAFPEKDDRGELQHVVVSFLDITNRRRSDAELEAVARITRLFRLALPLEETFREVSRILSTALRFPLAVIGTYQRDRQEMTIAGAVGMPGFVEGTSYPADRTLAGGVARSGVPCCERRLGLDPSLEAAFLRGLGYETFICVPIDVQGEVAGTVAVGDHVSRADAASWLATLTAVAGALSQELARRGAEDALRRSERKYRRLHESMTDAFVEVDLAGRVREFNRTYQEMLGYTQDELLALTYQELTPEKWHAAEAAIVQEQILPLGHSAVYEKEYRRKDGTVFPVELRSFLVRDDSGAPEAIWGIARDITARKRSEAVQLQTQKLQALGTLAGGVAHDFNNILLAIRGNASLAAEELPEGHPVRELVQEIDRAGVRAAGLVRQILAFARPRESAKAVVALGPVVDEALGLLRATLPAQIEIRSSLAAEVSPVAVDADQLHQALVNVVTNAALAIGRRAGRIDVTLEAKNVGEETGASVPGLRLGRYACLTVADDGCGMDAATLARAFDPFFTTRRPGEGTGLGLSIVHGIMQGHGGAVAIRSTPGAGTIVTLYFPAVAAPAAKAPDTPRAAAGKRGERILLVDDDDAIAALGRRSLGRLGYVVTAFTEPALAVADFAKAPEAYDAVVTDISMPGMTGFDVAAAVLAARPGIPVVITSGYIRPEDEVSAARLGVKALIAKPDTVDELAGALDRIFRAEVT